MRYWERSRTPASSALRLFRDPSYSSPPESPSKRQLPPPNPSSNTKEQEQPYYRMTNCADEAKLFANKIYDDRKRFTRCIGNNNNELIQFLIPYILEVTLEQSEWSRDLPFSSTRFSTLRQLIETYRKNPALVMSGLIPIFLNVEWYVRAREVEGRLF